ncbi:MAG: hypothetical protein ABIG90_01645 [bacterium]
MKAKVALCIIFLVLPFLMGQQGCESPLLPLVPSPSLAEETKEIRGTEISFYYDNDDLVKITVTHFHQGVKGKASIFLTNAQGNVLQALYQNLFFDLLNRIPNQGIIKKGIAKKGDLVGIDLEFKCLNPFGGCLKPDDFYGFYVLGSGQEITEIK